MFMLLIKFKLVWNLKVHPYIFYACVTTRHHVQVTQREILFPRELAKEVFLSSIIDKRPLMNISSIEV
jgi:hypothetical protein